MNEGTGFAAFLLLPIDLHNHKSPDNICDSAAAAAMAKASMAAAAGTALASSQQWIRPVGYDALLRRSCLIQTNCCLASVCCLASIT